MTSERAKRRLPVLALLGILLLPAPVPAETGVSLTSGNVVLSVDDGTLLTLAPGTELTLDEAGGGPPTVTLSAGEIYVSTVFTRGGALRIRSGETAFDLGRASVLFSRRDGELALTLLHGSGVLGRGGQRRTITPGTRISFGTGQTPRLDRPGPEALAGMVRRIGVAGGARRLRGRAGRRGVSGTRPLRDPLRSFRGRALQLDEFLALVERRQGTGRPPHVRPRPPKGGHGHKGGKHRGNGPRMSGGGRGGHGGSRKPSPR